MILRNRFRPVVFLLLLLLRLERRLVCAQERCRSNSLKVPALVIDRPKALTIAHRGASSHLPEHTLPAYRLALELGADYIQPDILSTDDAHLVAVHTADLNKTTNVAEVFPDRTWYSPWVEREAYWVFNFTLEEIRQLRVTQNIEDSRATMYDMMFRIPTLEEILRVLNKWNWEDLPEIIGYYQEEAESNTDGYRPTRLELAQSGLYMELKDIEWLREEADLDITYILLDHFDRYKDLWAPLQQCYGDIPYDQYKVPPLVLQSFDAEGLEEFHDLYTKSDYLNEVAEPKYVLLTDDEDCWEDQFWSDISRTYRTFLSGIGAEKICLLDPDNSPFFLRKVKENNLIVHSFTERPEQDYIEYGDSSLEETQYLICNQGASGIFSESISTSVLAATLPCPDGSAAANQQCYQSSLRSNFYVALVFFILGSVATGFLLYWWAEKRRRRLASTQANPSPAEAYHDSSPAVDEYGTDSQATAPEATPPVHDVDGRRIDLDESHDLEFQHEEVELT